MSNLVNSRENDPRHNAQAEADRIMAASDALGLVSMSTTLDDGEHSIRLLVTAAPNETLRLLNSLPKPLRTAVEVVRCQEDAITLRWEWKL